VEELIFQLLDRRDMALLQGGSVKHWVSVYLGETGLLVPPAE
jgi:hypothetical protein